MTHLFVEALFCLAGALQQGAPAAVEVRVDSPASTTTFQVRRDANGLLFLDGTYRRADPNDLPLTTGRFVRGRRQDEWRTYHAGARRVRDVVTYSAGKRRGKYVRYDSEGRVESSGSFESDRPMGAWIVEGANVQFGTLEELERGFAATGPTRNQRRDGLWRVYWPNGELQQVGTYREGRRAGEWSFFHVDGTFDPEFVSGWYDDGVRVRDASTPTTAAPAGEPMFFPPAPSSLDVCDPRSLRDAASAAEWPSQLSLAEVEQAEGGERGAQTRLAFLVRALGAPAFEALVERMRHCDLEDPTQVARAEALAHILESALHRRGFGWSAATDRGARRDNALRWLRWYSFVQLHKTSRPFWTIDLDGLSQLEPGERDPELFTPCDETRRFSASAQAFFEQRHTRNLRARGGQGVEQSLDDALDWLAAHQSEDGGWSADRFNSSCGPRSLDRCPDVGRANGDVGVTGLALLALLGKADAVRGEHADVIERAVKSLLDRQDPTSGWIGFGRPRSEADAHAESNERKPNEPESERKCSTCAGRGQMSCSFCGGTGLSPFALPTSTTSGTPCVMCRGGWIDCSRCDGGVMRSTLANTPRVAPQAQGSGAWIYCHAIATWALCEASAYLDSPLLHRRTQLAIDFLLSARNPYSGWRYQFPPTGDADTSITGWAVLALESARAAGFEVDAQAVEDGRTFFSEMTDTISGRVGYDTRSRPGGRSERVQRVNDHFPVEANETLTAVALTCRLLLGDDPERHEILWKQAGLVRARLPLWEPSRFGIDLYAWFWGSHAMFQIGGTHWETWSKALKEALLHSQRQDGHAKGSWDASVDVWGSFGGRVYTTAMGALCLESYFRYPRGLGAR